MDCSGKQKCNYFKSTRLQTTDICETRPRPKDSYMEQYQEVCRITRSVPNYTSNVLDFVGGFGSHVKGLLKMKQCNSVSFSFPFQPICETTLNFLKFLTVVTCHKSIDKQGRPRSDCFGRGSLIRAFPFAILERIL